VLFLPMVSTVQGPGKRGSVAGQGSIQVHVTSKEKVISSFGYVKGLKFVVSVVV
jgi:hypothetical protein